MTSSRTPIRSELTSRERRGAPIDVDNLQKGASGVVRLLILEGDGIGPEIVRSTVSVLRAVGDILGIEFSFDFVEIGFSALRLHGSTFPPCAIEKAKLADGIVLGPVSHNEYPSRDNGGHNPSAALRSGLDLYANIRPARPRGGLPPRCGKHFDLVFVRENTEGFYADRSMFLGPGEMMPTPDLALSFRKVSRSGSMRIAEHGFSLAAQRKRKVTAVHKANVLRVTDGLFLECVRQVAANYPHVTYEEVLVDAMAALLIRDASGFDVVVTTNMFGDILSDEASELAGSLGLAASLNVGAAHAVAQAQHGSAPDIAGQDIANPSSLIGSAAMLLSWLGNRRGDETLTQGAALVEEALDTTISEPGQRTRDLGGPLGTSAFTAKLIENLKFPGSDSGTLPRNGRYRAPRASDR